MTPYSELEPSQQSAMDDYDTPAPTCDDCFSPRAALAIRIAAGTVAAVSFAWFTYATFPFRSRDALAVTAYHQRPPLWIAPRHCHSAPRAISPETRERRRSSTRSRKTALAPSHCRQWPSRRSAAERRQKLCKFLPCAPATCSAKAPASARQSARGSCARSNRPEAIALLLATGCHQPRWRQLAVRDRDFGASRDGDRSAQPAARRPAGRPSQQRWRDILFTQTGLAWRGRPLADAADLPRRLRRDACRVAARANGSGSLCCDRRSQRAARRPWRLRQSATGGGRCATVGRAFVFSRCDRVGEQQLVHETFTSFSSRLGAAAQRGSTAVERVPAGGRDGAPRRG